MPRFYFDTEVEAHTAAREQSKTAPCGLFVRDDANGFYISPLGLPGSLCYFGGHAEDEIMDNQEFEP